MVYRRRRDDVRKAAILSMMLSSRAGRLQRGIHVGGYTVGKLLFKEHAID